MSDLPEAPDGFSSSAPSLIGAAIFGLMAAATLCGVVNQLGVANDAIVLGFAAFTLLVVLGIAMAARSGRADDHLFAGAALTPVASGLATAASFGLVSTVLLPGLVYQNGFDGLIPLVGIAGGLVLLLALVGPAMSRAGAATVPDLIGLRFGRLLRAAALVIAVLCSAGLLVAALGSGVSLATRIFDLPASMAAAAGVAILLGVVLPGGVRSVSWAGLIFYLMAATLLIGGVAAATYAVLGNPVPQIAYGASLKEIAPAEEALVEAGLINFGLFKPFLKEFLTVDSLNWALLTLSLMAAIAVLPPLVQSTRTVRAPSEARRGVAWALLFVVVLLTAVPAVAAIARLEVYRAVSAGSVFAELPQWIRSASAAGAVRLHGASAGMVEEAAAALSEGLKTVETAGKRFSERGGATARAWQRLDGSVQEAILAAARAQRAAGPEPEAQRWSRFAGTVLPVAARAAGNETGKPDLAAVALDPETLVLALPAVLGLPAALGAVAVAAVLGAALAVAAFLLATIAGLLAHDGAGVVLGRSLSHRGHVMLSRLAAVAAAGLAGAVVLLVPVTPDLVFVASLSLAAAGLLPVLVLGIWWPRANAWGAFAGLAAGLALGGYYLIGTTLFSVTFYDTWAGLSNAGPEAFAEFEELKAMLVAAEGDARAAVFNDLAARASGGLWSPGLANWLGVAPAAGAALAIPLAVIVAMLVSLVTPRPGSGAQNLLDRIHPWRRRGAQASSNPPAEGGG